MRNLILTLAILLSGIASAQNVGNLSGASHTDSSGTERLFTVASRDNGAVLSFEEVGVQYGVSELYTVVDTAFLFPLYPAASEWSPAWNISAVSSSTNNIVQTRTVNGIEESRTITYRYALQTPLYTWGGDPYYGITSPVNRISAGVDAAKREALRISMSGSTIGVYEFSRPVYSVDSNAPSGIETLIGRPNEPQPYLENGFHVSYTGGIQNTPPPTNVAWTESDWRVAIAANPVSYVGSPTSISMSSNVVEVIQNTEWPFTQMTVTLQEAYDGDEEGVIVFRRRGNTVVQLNQVGDATVEHISATEKIIRFEESEDALDTDEFAFHFVD